MPLTGAISIYGNTCKEAIDLAVAQTNAAGGVLGKDGQIVNMDNKSAGPESALAAEKLIGAGVVGILGPVAASNSLAAGSLAQGAGIPLVSPTSTNEAVTEIGDYIFRACFIDPFQGYVGEFVETDQDFSAILTSVKAENPDVVYVPSYYETAGSILRQAAKLEIDAYFIGADGWDSPGLFDIAGDVEPSAIRDALAATDGFVGVSGTITYDEKRNPVKSVVIIEIVDQEQVFRTIVNSK